MISLAHVQMMAAYNKWQNDSLYGAADTLDDDARRTDRGWRRSPFGSPPVPPPLGRAEPASP